MNKYLTLTLALIASQAVAADIGLGAAMSVNASSSADKELLGSTLTAEYAQQVSDKASAFASANIFVSPKSFTASGPKSANFIVGGTFSREGSPASAQFGVGVTLVSPADAEDSVLVAPALFSGAKLEINDEYALTTRLTHTMPITKLGEIESSMLTADFGFQKRIAIEA
ncbi:MAG: hypothetical protein VXW87_03920 [Pseudomonadota bacterium]|nr:hypothetical protein [Pseudomonadota bacterium]